MRSFVRASFVWQFATGFALGAVGLLTLQPADATRSITQHLPTLLHGTR